MSNGSTNSEPVDSTALDLLGGASTATITTRLFAYGLRNTCLVGVTPLNPNCAHFVGEAFTLRYIPAREDIDDLSVYQDYDHPQRRAVESVQPGQVLVMDCRGRGRAASAGHILVTRLLRRGVAGLVTDGSLRDSPAISRTDLPVFCSGVSATTNLAQHHAVDLQVPIGCAEVPVYPGDILVGDEEGVVCVPRRLAAEIAEPAAEQERVERFVLSEIENGAPLRGTYPPDESTLTRYREWRGPRTGCVRTEGELSGVRGVSSPSAGDLHGSRSRRADEAGGSAGFGFHPRPLVSMNSVDCGGTGEHNGNALTRRVLGPQRLFVVSGGNRKGNETSG